MSVVYKVHIPIYLFALLKYTVLYNITSEHQGIPWKARPTAISNL